ncbi:UNKNOWN [Stylonychia lemnae]|uniref:Uncharacterized protein n=1 Tax=Stylonychia lemnae TaxID=5949 RepID=A0A078ARE0_STYLE|nr:UNKNOWN [Stylonychia lemnae]|eukprot:CDW85015.1 UNKNOWN [Stylonychia lemnae]
MYAKIFTVLGLAATTAMALEIDISAKVNQTLEFIQDAQDFSESTYSDLQQNKKDYKKTILKILQDAEKEVQTNYQRVIQPVAEDYAAFLKTLKVNENCDEECVSQVCFSPEKWAMNWTCVAKTCNCNLRDINATLEAKAELKESVRNVTERVVPAFLQEKATLVNEAYRSYRLKQVGVINSAARKIEKKIVSVVPEAQNCFNLCYKYYGTDLTTYVPCVGKCTEQYDSLERQGVFNKKI